MAAADYILNFTYAGSDVKLDLDIVALRLLTEAQHVIDNLKIEKESMIWEMRKSGVPIRDAAKEADRVILNMIKNSEGIIKTFENRQNRLIAELTKQMVAAPANMLAGKNKDKKFAWVLGSVKTHHCPDCLALSKMPPRTIQEWRDLGFGVPREGLTECKQGCQCLLKPAKEKNVENN